MKITLTARTPRNPFAAAARRRLAGAHRRTASGQRQQARQLLRRELQHERQPMP
jgi:hypothetical protein